MSLQEEETRRLAYRRKLSESGRSLLRWSLELDDSDSEEPLNDRDLGTNPDFEEQIVMPSRSHQKKSYTSSMSETDYEDAKNKLDHSMELITEKKANLRVDALELINETLSSKVCSELAFSMRGELTSEILNVLRKKNTPGECVLACRALALMCITLGADEDNYYQGRIYTSGLVLTAYGFLDIQPTLMKTIQTAKADAVRAAALEALAVGCFVCSTDDQNTTEVLSLCEKFFSFRLSNAAEESAFTALEMWGLLITSLASERVVENAMDSEEDFGSQLLAMKTVLDHPNIDLRISCGENFALIAEMMHELDEHWSIFDEPPESPFGGVLDRIQGFRAQDSGAAVMSRSPLSTILELSQESSKKVSKKGKKNLRAACRVIAKTLTDNIAPTVDIQMRGLNVILHKWAEVKQYNALKSVLQGAFQEHFVNNPLIQDILVSEDNMVTAEHYSAEREKKVHNAKSSSARKQRSKGLRTLRDNRDAARGVYET